MYFVFLLAIFHVLFINVERRFKCRKYEIGRNEFPRMEDYFAFADHSSRKNEIALRLLFFISSFCRLNEIEIREMLSI